MARLDARRVAGVLADPAAWRLILLHGEDQGLVQERSAALIAAVIGDPDPFRFAELSREAAARPGALIAETTAGALTGGRRVVRVRDATDALAPALKAALAAPGEALILAEAGALKKRCKLLDLVEPAPDACAILCAPERGDTLVATLRRMFAAEGVEADAAALDWIAARAPDDRQAVRREVERLALYAGRGGVLDEAALLASSGGDGSGPDLDDALAAAMVGDVAGTDRAVAGAFADGAAPVAVLRAILRHLVRLREAAVAVERGASPSDAMAGLRPQVFGRGQAAFGQALRRWSPAMLAAAAQAALEAEERAKSGGTGRPPVPDAALARQLLMTLANRAAARQR
ncbi:DNA polymerase III subunit delta [Humitalea sp. 24SJ18S-53]|uniref:DNA polymerase III subunit delta n=1 Tax=Humitalea sp. 24SJ18S-53 TaxID=3422307 RepID=UPI003D667F4E